MDNPSRFVIETLLWLHALSVNAPHLMSLGALRLQRNAARACVLLAPQLHIAAGDKISRVIAEAALQHGWNAADKSHVEREIHSEAAAMVADAKRNPLASTIVSAFATINDGDARMQAVQFVGEDVLDAAQ